MPSKQKYYTLLSWSMWSMRFSPKPTPPAYYPWLHNLAMRTAILLPLAATTKKLFKLIRQD